MTDLEALNKIKSIAKELGLSDHSTIVKAINQEINYVQNGGTL